MKIYDTNPDSFFKLFLLQFTYIFTSFFSRFATLADARIDKIDSALQAVPKESGIAIVFPRLGCLGSIFHRITVNDVSSRWNAVGSVVARSVVVTDRRHVSVKSGEEYTRRHLHLRPFRVALTRHPRVSPLRSPLPPRR